MVKSCQLRSWGSPSRRPMRRWFGRSTRHERCSASSLCVRRARIRGWLEPLRFTRSSTSQTQSVLSRHRTRQAAIDAWREQHSGRVVQVWRRTVPNSETLIVRSRCDSTPEARSNPAQASDPLGPPKRIARPCTDRSPGTPGAQHHWHTTTRPRTAHRPPGCCRHRPGRTVRQRATPDR